MAISTGRKTALDALKSWLEAISVANGYQTNVAEVKRGVHLFDEMVNRPAICIWNEKGPKTELAEGPSGVSDRTLHIWAWGYVDIQPGNYDNLDALVADIEKCINTSHTNWAAADIKNVKIGESAYYEGGVNDPVGICEMEILLEYRYSRVSP